MWLMELDLSPYSDIVTNGLLQHVSKYRNLQSLDLAHYKEIVDPALCLIAASFPNLRHLDIFGCQALLLLSSVEYKCAEVFAADSELGRTQGTGQARLSNYRRL